jgi:glycerol-3-phosphate dehydrogenase (NAD(P)+)
MIDISANYRFNARSMRSGTDKKRSTSHSTGRLTAEPQVAKYETISIIGDGGMATALAILLCEKIADSNSVERIQKEKLSAEHYTLNAIRCVRMWGYDRRQLAQIEQAGENKKFLPGYKFPKTLIFEPDDERVMVDTDLIISAVPSQFMRSVWTRLKDYVPTDIPIVSVAKGIENGTLLRPTQILADVLEPKLKTQNSKLKTAVLSGPTIADELARKLPATACVASRDEQLAKDVQQTFFCPWLRVYTNTDVVGVELAGAMKNIIAIAAGIVDGTRLGDNAKAALLTRGLVEITRLGLAMGARPQTFAGLTGLGDLVTTCISPKGRNRSFGERVGKGRTVQQARDATESVVEGIATCSSVVALAAKYDVEMPITQAVYEVIFENKPVQTAIEELMTRKLKSE